MSGWAARYWHTIVSDMIVSLTIAWHSSTPRTTTIPWHKGSYASLPLFLFLSFPVIPPLLPSSSSLPPFGIFLVQWPPFTTITQISWAGVILSHRSAPLGGVVGGGGGGWNVAEFPFCLCDSAIWQHFTSPLLSPHYTPLSDKEINTPSDCVLIKQFHANYTF